MYVHVLCIGIIYLVSEYTGISKTALIKKHINIHVHVRTYVVDAVAL